MKFFLLFLMLLSGASVMALNRSFEVTVCIYDEDKVPIDDALIKIYDKNHKFLCEKKSDVSLMGYNSICDSTIRNYGIYYVEISKIGYKTVEEKIELLDSDVQSIPEIVLLPVSLVSGKWRWGVGIIILLLAALGVIYKYKK